MVTGLVEKGETDASLSGQKREAALFPDIQGFTTLSERKTPQEIVDLLNRCFSMQVEVIFRHEGTLDKYTGDAIMAFWGAPTDQADRDSNSPITVSSNSRARRTGSPGRTKMGAAMKRWIILILAAGLAAALSAAEAKETGATRTTVSLQAAPYRDAKQQGQLPSNTRVDILERRGGWLRVSTKGQTGWVRLHQVRAGAGARAKKSGEGLAMLRNVGQTGRSGSQGIVTTTGIRGMSAEELKHAKPNPEAVTALERYRANDRQAREHAKAAGLKEKDVAVLPKPE